MGGGFFDNMWDPYSGAFAYPRTQPRARYYRPRAPVYEQHPVYEQRGSVQPENHFPGKVKVEDSARKTVRTIPVTDGSGPVEVKAQPVEVKAQPVVRFDSDDAAARKIQTVYRGYSVRRTEPLKHLRVIMKVREEFEGLKRRFEDREVRVRVAGDAQERLRWTEGIMALLLRLDQLQGVHPEIRVFRKATAKELLMFQEKVDSMSDSVVEESVGADVTEEKDAQNRSAPEEESEVCDAEVEGTDVADGDGNVPGVEALEEMEVDEDNVDDVNVEEATQVEVEESLANDRPREEVEQDNAPQEESEGGTLVEGEGASANDALHEAVEHDGALLEENMDETQANDAHQETMEQVVASLDESTDRELTSDGVKVSEDPTSEQLVPHEEVTSFEDPSRYPSDRIGESMVEYAEQDGMACRVPTETLMDVEDESSTMAPAKVEAVSPHAVPPMDVDKEEVSGVDDGPPAESQSVSKSVYQFSREAELVHSTKKNEDHDVGTERLAPGAGSSELDNNGDGPRIHEERATDAGAMAPCEGWIVSASPTSLEPRQSSAKSLQVGEPQISGPGDTTSLSDRALLEQLLEENRKLKDVVGKVLHWGKQQNDIIQSLASRIEHLEEKQPPANLLAGEQMNGRKRICHDGGLVGDRERSPRSKGRRRGRQSGRNQLGYLDSEWLSADSDEYF